MLWGRAVGPSSFDKLRVNGGGGDTLTPALSQDGRGGWREGRVTKNIEYAGEVVGLDWMPGMDFLRRVWGVGVFRVKGRSMEPAFCEGDFLFVWGGNDAKELGRWDVVVFSHPSVQGRLMLKRVAALPGERVGMVAGRMIVDAGGNEWEGDEVWDVEWVLGEDECFVLGDNLGSSLDSRRLGPIRGSWIRGRVWFRYWPPLRW